jgi:hypothetical protein
MTLDGDMVELAIIEGARYGRILPETGSCIIRRKDGGSYRNVGSDTR